MGLVPYGYISKTHGLNGEVCLITFSRDFSNLQFIKNIYLNIDSSTNFQIHKLISYYTTAKYAVLNLSELNDKDSVSHLKNKTIYINTAELPDTKEDEYYWFQLVGMQVFGIDGALIGKVIDLLERTQQSLLVLRDKKHREILIPFVRDIVTEIDLQKKVITIDPPEGLLEIN